MLGDMNLVTTIIGFGMSSTFIVFVCTRLICVRLRVGESREIDLEQAVQGSNGLEPAMVAAIPTMKFTHDAFSSIEEAQCSICLGEYQEKEILRIMPKCGHNFHLSCIDIWLRKQSTCPVCRLALEESTFGRDHASLVSFSLSLSDHNNEISLDHLRHSVPLGSQHSIVNDTSQQNHSRRSLEPNLVTESETRQ